jgi:glutathione S-transferase
MKLYYSPLSPFARKVMICAHENALLERIALVDTDTLDEGLRQLNPLCKIPTLELEDGLALYDSRVICEHLDSLGTGVMIPEGGPERLRTRLLEALGDGISDATLRRVMELRRSEPDRHADVIERQTRAMTAGMTEAQRLIAPGRFALGEAAIIAALIYIDTRLPQDPWRIRFPVLAGWFAETARRPSVAGTGTVRAP